MKVLHLTKQYIISPNVFNNDNSVDDKDIIFAHYLNKLHNQITTDNLIYVWPLVDYQEETISDYIKKQLIEEFKLNKSFELITLDTQKQIQLSDNNDIVIKLVDNINNKQTIDFICKLTLYYKYVYIVNFIYNNPIDNIFYVVCKDKNNKETTNINISSSDYITNINENRRDIFKYLYTCYYYWACLQKGDKNLLDKHFKLLKKCRC